MGKNRNTLIPVGFSDMADADFVEGCAQHDFPVSGNVQNEADSVFSIRQAGRKIFRHGAAEVSGGVGAVHIRE